MIELNNLGRLLSYNPETGNVKVLLDSLYMPNGIALSPDEDFLLLAETSIGRIVKYSQKYTVHDGINLYSEVNSPLSLSLFEVLAKGPDGWNHGNHHGQHDRLP